MAKRAPTDRDSDTTADDVTVMRSNSGAGTGVNTETPRVLKQRFVLEHKLGSGGMGTVYQAKDLRKVEARDRSPYVAIKVLNNDFRAHPDAFIALQREASKSQAIAHPNIVSIFDFDKDGDIPYMTMELLEGKELAELLREFPNGLPDALLWPALEGLCAGLKRAHDAGIIHADLKPGNIFITKSGVPKILDFGIARAVRSHQYEGEDTVFDPAKLAALTPAYASAQMLTGETPTPADDVYSFGVVAYLMLTGHHPYDRVRADEAAKQGLVPERPKRLSKRQWRILERTLAFDRETRPASVDEIIGRLLRPSPARPWIIAALVVVSVAAAMLVWLGPANIERAEVARDAVSGAQVSRIDTLLATTAADIDSSWHDRIVEELTALANIDQGGTAAAARQRVLTVYADRIADAPDLDAAALWLARGETLSPEGRFQAGRQVFEGRLRAALKAALSATPVDAQWRVRVTDILERHATLFADSPHRTEMVQAAVTRMLAVLPDVIAADDVTLARHLLDDARRMGGDAATIDALVERLTERDTALARARADAARRTQARTVDTQLERLTGNGCQRLDVTELSQAAAGLRRRFPAESRRIDSAVAAYVSNCVISIGAIDQDRAMSLQREALAAFPDASALRATKLDPCGMAYLIGRGNQPGRGGFCVDELTGGASGPRLVVVPIEGGRLAVSKYEISWGTMAEFCAQTADCGAAGAAADPARNLNVATVRAFARWLSAASGRGYRLPTMAEWRQLVGAATDPPDPNRNCSLRTSGMSRGAAVTAVTVGLDNRWGLVNVLGNVREWVDDASGLLAVGGSFADPLPECVVSMATPHDGSADDMTGFRLVREVQ